MREITDIFLRAMELFVSLRTSDGAMRSKEGDRERDL